MKHLLILAFAAFFSLTCGCVTYPDTSATSLPSDLAAIRHTTAGEESNPVFLSFTADSLVLRYKGIGAGDLFVTVPKKACSEYMAAVGKFLEWEKTAQSRGETFTKRIAGIEYASGAILSVRFKSLTKQKHVVVFGVRSKLLGEDFKTDNLPDLEFDRENAERFLKLLERFSSGTLAGAEYR